MTDTQKTMILDWMRKIHQLEYAHRFESLGWTKIERFIGISAFIISTLIVFSYRFQWIDSAFYVPIASMIVALLTGLQTFLRPSEKSETHKKTGSNYEKLRHRIEVILTSDSSDRDLNKKLENIREEWANLDAINVNSKNFNKGKEKVKSLNKYPKELDFLPDANQIIKAS